MFFFFYESDFFFICASYTFYNSYRCILCFIIYFFDKTFNSYEVYIKTLRSGDLSIKNPIDDNCIRIIISEKKNTRPSVEFFASMNIDKRFFFFSSINFYDLYKWKKKTYFTTSVYYASGGGEGVNTIFNRTSRIIRLKRTTVVRISR